MTSLISNPPYNIRWQIPPLAQTQPRFSHCDLPPASNANYAFVLTALDKIDGKASFILPNGILTQDNEKSIRAFLVDKNYIESIILCPNNMFEATAISTCVVTLNKNKQTQKVMMIDMRQCYHEEIRLQNGQCGDVSHTNRTYEKTVKAFSDEQIEQVLRSISEQVDVVGYCKSVANSTIRENGYDLRPSCYIEFEHRETPHRQYIDIVNDINRIIEARNCCKLTINETVARGMGINPELYSAPAGENTLSNLTHKVVGAKITKDNYIQFSKNKNEIKFENNSKSELSIILQMIMSQWKTHIAYLNSEENRYLAELRDALLPNIMSGKIDLSEENTMESEENQQ